MAPSFKEKTAFITGGSAGIGKAACEALLQKGIKVCLADINTTAGEKTLRELQSKYGDGNVMFVKCDVSSEKELEESIVAAKQKFGHLDIIINNAGILLESDWEKTININTIGVMHGTMLAFKHLSDSEGKKGGTVINTASNLAFEIQPMMPAYCASKFAVGAWTRCWGDELNVKRTGVRVCAVCPNATDTDLLWKVPELTVDKTSATAMIDAIKDELLTPADIAKGFIKVLEDEASGVLLQVMLTKELKYMEKKKYNP